MEELREVRLLLELDTEHNLGYLNLSHERNVVDVVEPSLDTINVWRQLVHLDFGKEGQLIGIEFLDIQRIPPSLIAASTLLKGATWK